jgi:hypothetical protein
VTAIAGNRSIPGGGGRTNHAGAGDGSSRRRGSGAVGFGDCDRRLQSLLSVCKRIGSAVVLGAGDRGGSGDRGHVAASFRLWRGAGAAILAVFRGAAGRHDSLANWIHQAADDDRPVADTCDRNHAGDCDAAIRSTFARRHWRARLAGTVFSRANFTPRRVGSKPSTRWQDRPRKLTTTVGPSSAIILRSFST